MQLPPLLSSAQLLAALNEHGHCMSHKTLWMRSHGAWSDCVVDFTPKSTTWSRQRLEDAGILPRTAAAAPEVHDGIAFSFTAKGIA